MEIRPQANNNDTCQLILCSDKLIGEVKGFLNRRIDPILWEEEQFKPSNVSKSLNEDINTLFDLRASCNNFQKDTDSSTCPSDCVTKSQYYDIVGRISRRMVQYNSSVRD